MANVLQTLHLSVVLTGTASGSAGLGTASAAIEERFNLAFTGGAGALQVSKMYSGERTLTASSTEDLDLAGVLIDDLSGAAVTFATIKIVMIVAAAANANSVIIGGASANQFQGWFGAVDQTEEIKPGGISLKACPSADGWTVTAATGDKFKVANGAGGSSVIYRILILGD